jgi:ABC-type sugar transport system permease subunit
VKCLEVEQEILIETDETVSRDLEPEVKPLRKSIKDLLFLLPAYLALILFVFIPIGYSLLISFHRNPNPLELRFAFDYYSLDGLLSNLISAALVLIIGVVLYNLITRKFKLGRGRKIGLIIGIVMGCIFLFILFYIILLPLMRALGVALDSYNPAVDPGELSVRSLYDFFFLDDPLEKGLFQIEGIYVITVIMLTLLYSKIFYSKIFKKRIRKIKNTLAKVGLAFLSGLIVGPLTLVIFELIMKGIPATTLIPFPLDEYRDVLTSPIFDFIKILFNTFFWTLTCTFIHVILGMGLAILLNRKFFGRGVFRSLFILPWAIPSFVSTLMWRAYVFDRERGVLGVLWSDFGNSYSFSLGNLLGLFIAVIAGVYIIRYAYRLLNKYVKITPMFRPLMLLGFAVLTILLIVFFNDLLQILVGLYQQEFVDYNIINIPEINSTFWYTDDVYIFGYKFKMITFSAILVNVWLGVPFMMLSFLATLQSIPNELYEAAQIDGLTNWEQFKKVTLPLLKPTLLTVSLLGIIWTFNLFNVVYLLSQNQTGLGDAIFYQIFVTFIYERFNEFNDYAAASALSFTVFIILISFSIVYRRIIRVEQLWEGEK